MADFNSNSPSTSSKITNDEINKVVVGNQGAKDCIKICHVNAQSIPANYIEFLRLFSNQAFDIITVSETWFKQCHSNKAFSLFGYKLYRNDRYDKRGGGIGVYIKQTLKSKVLFTTPHEYNIKQY